MYQTNIIARVSKWRDHCRDQTDRSEREIEGADGGKDEMVERMEGREKRRHSKQEEKTEELKKSTRKVKSCWNRIGIASEMYKSSQK